MFSASRTCRSGFNPIYFPRLEDCLINQVLLQGLRLASGLTNDVMLRTHLFQLINFHLSDISSIQLNQHTFKQLHREMDRLVNAYTPVITLIEMLFAGEGMSLDESHVERRLPGFLFDMNIFFQELLARFLGEHLQDYIVETQFELENMMVYVDNPGKREAPRPRPLRAPFSDIRAFKNSIQLVSPRFYQL
jgi:5-methylcytosine-specific restriction enzyme subunit McrC